MEKEKQIIKPDEIEFYDQSLLTIEINGKSYTAARPISDHMGLAWTSQRQKLRNSDKFNCDDIITVGKDGRIRKMLFIPVEELNAWLFSINADKVKPELRDIVIKYQKECVMVLYQYWTKGKAENPRFKDQKNISRIEAQNIFNSFVSFNMNFGDNQSRASIKAMNSLLEEYNYDIAAAQGMTREEAEAFVIAKYGKPVFLNPRSRHEWKDRVLCDWINIMLDDPGLWKGTTSLNIEDFYNDYIDFCRTQNKEHETYNGWTRKIRAIFEEHVRRVQKSGESRRYYKFADIDTCRKQLEKYTGEQLWPPVPVSDVIN